MDRRAAGSLLMVLILVGAVTVPGIAGRTVGGTAAPGVRVQPQPRTGDCLGPLISPEQLNSVFDTVPVVPCSQLHSAEILAVGLLDRNLWRIRPTVGDAAFTSGALSEHCDQLAGAFLGWGGNRGSARIQVSFFTRLTVPDDLEWQLGQRWYACQVLPGVLDYPISYAGTAREASFRTPPGAFASCSDGPGELAVSCDHPHSAEQIARTFDTTSAASADGRCRQLVGDIVGTKDPTFNGQLALLTRVQGGATACWVTTTSSRNLTATLINHGNKPLPLR